MIGKYLNGYAQQPAGAARLVGVARGRSRARPARLQLHAQRQRHPGRLRPGPRRLQAGRADPKAVDFVNRRAPKAQPFFLWLTYTAPHVGGPDPNPNPPSDCSGAAKPAPRHAHAFDSEPLPRPPNFNEADVSDKPAAIRNLPRLNASQIANIQRKYRCELESLLSVDEGVKKVVDALRANGELEQHAGHLHLRQRLLPRRAPDLPMARGTSTRSRSGCRSRCAGRASRRG